ncbi:MAG TPA: malate synthase A [Gemmatimonadaceae bacterium]|nr:malate synthase A [Gemmatimonadaceae bacterium]
MTARAGERVQLVGERLPDSERILTEEALAFVARLHREFNPTRESLLRARAERQRELESGAVPGFLGNTASVRESEWRVAPAPRDLEDRRVEITGPVERKMMINALNSGASCFMADFEDALSPTWENVIAGQGNLIDAVRRTLSFASPEGKAYALNHTTATLLVRPRGWHLVERHVTIDGQPMSASLFDFGLYFFHNARELLQRNTGPYFYLPKMESHREARLWNDVFIAAQDWLGIPRGTIRATVLIETILAALEMDEILHELRDHAAGLNAGRWDYIFSAIKKFRLRPETMLPDRAQVTMTVPFMRAYTELLVKTCHRRGAHAMGGMAAFVPSRRDAKVNETALAKVREDKLRESGDGFDGTWVAHPDLVPVARQVFDGVLGSKPNQKDRQRPEVNVSAEQILDVRVPGGTVTASGAKSNISVALQYLESWMRGSGAVAIYNLMEDTATAEISRAQLWQWLRHGADVDGERFTREMYERVRDAEIAALSTTGGHTRLRDAAALLDELVLGDDFTEFLTLPGERYLEDGASSATRDTTGRAS